MKLNKQNLKFSSLSLLFVFFIYSAVSHGQLVQYKGLQFYQQTEGWDGPVKLSVNSEQMTKSGPNKSEGIIHYSVHKSKKIESTEALAKEAIETQIGAIWDKVKPYKIDKLEINYKEELDFSAYSSETKLDGVEYWVKVYVVEYKEKGLVFVYTAICKSPNYPDRGLIKDLEMMLGTISVIKK